MQIELTKRFRAAVQKLPDEDAAAVDAALQHLPVVFGRPHVHTGISVRAFRPPIYELRATRDLRVMFLHCGSVLKVDFVGTHAQVMAYVRNRR